jgi:hypothetical protein
MWCSDAVAICIADPAISNAPRIVKAPFRILDSVSGHSAEATASRVVRRVSREIMSENGLASYAGGARPSRFGMVTACLLIVLSAIPAADLYSAPLSRRAVRAMISFARNQTARRKWYEMEGRGPLESRSEPKTARTGAAAKTQRLIHHPRALPISAVFGLRYVHTLVRKWAASGAYDWQVPEVGMRPVEW